MSLDTGTGMYVLTAVHRVCFIPVLPLATKKYQELACPICNFHQDLRDRPDVQSMQGQHQQAGYQQAQGWGGQGPPGTGPKPQYG